MEQDPQQKLARLRELVERGEYAIDPDAVADAVLKRLRLLSALRAEIERTLQRSRPYLVQNECSYPESGPEMPGEPTNASPLPSVTRPIHVIRPARSFVATAASIALRAAAGAQTQSS